jgi:hypothetical protein
MAATTDDQRAIKYFGLTTAWSQRGDPRGQASRWTSQGDIIMEKEIKYRLFGLESIIHRLHHNLGLTEMRD